MFEWDEAKSWRNVIESGFAFDIVLQLDWDTSITERDDRRDYGEVRYRTFGRIDGVAYCVAWTARGDRARIISVRRARESEANRYGI